MEILRARSESVEDINILIRNSKSFWEYPQSYLNKAIPLLMVNESYLNENTAFEIRLNKDLVGFFAFVFKGHEVHLDHLWIAPSKMNKGFGQQTLLFAEKFARANGWSEIITYPDPPAEGFYLKSGFVDTGGRIPSRIEGGPQFSIFKKVYSSSQEFEVK